MSLEGDGTTPAAVMPHPPARAALGPDAPAVGRRILVIEDSPEDAEVVRRYVRRTVPAPWQLDFARTGEDALERVQRDRPDCVLLDYHLPDMTGVELLARLGPQDAVPVPVVMLTGSVSEVGTAVEAMRRGAQDYLFKSALTGHDLYRAVENAIERFTQARLIDAHREELLRRNRALDAYAERTARLLAVSTALSGALAPTAVADVVLDDALAATGASVGVAAAVYGDGTLHPLKMRGAGSDDASHDAADTAGAWRAFPLDVLAPLAEAVLGGEAIWLASPQEAAARFPALAPAWRAAGAEALVILPLLAERRALGALALAFGEACELSGDERAYLLTLARQGAQALERARLYAEAEQARAEAEAANAAKSKFLATMSHELRTPLNAIRGYAELLELGIVGPVTADQLGMLARIRKSELHLHGIISEILDFARLETGRTEFRPRALRLGDVIAEAYALVEPQLLARGLRAELAGGADDVAVWADPDRTRQILVNLLSNAAKFTDPGGRVTLGGEVWDGVALVRVADSGRGIAPEALESIFQPFVQLGRDLNRPQEGTGLGLAISRELARGMGGDLTAASAPGRGSTFTLTLPRA